MTNEMSRMQFIQSCFVELLADGEPHRYREIIDHVRRRMFDEGIHGHVDVRNVVNYIKPLLEEADTHYMKIRHGIYQKMENTAALECKISNQLEAAYEFLDEAAALQQKFENLRSAQLMELPGAEEALNPSCQIISEHFDKLIDGIAFWLADMEDLEIENAPAEEINEAMEMQI